MDALGDYGSDESDENSFCSDSKLLPVSRSPLLNVAVTCRSEPVPRPLRRSSNSLDVPPTEEVCTNMVLWSDDCLSDKLEQSERALNVNADAANVSHPSMLPNVNTTPVDWLDTLHNDPEFTNPHQLEAVANDLGITRSLAPSEALQAWETVERLQEMERDALIKQQAEYQRRHSG